MITVILKGDLECRCIPGDPFPGGQALNAKIIGKDKLVVIHPNNPKFARLIRGEQLWSITVDFPEAGERSLARWYGQSITEKDPAWFNRKADSTNPWR